MVLFCAPKENQKSARYFRGAGGTNQGLLALDNPKVERLHTKNLSRFARSFFLVSPIYGFADGVTSLLTVKFSESLKFSAKP